MIVHGWQVPDVLLGAVIAAVISLVATALTNRQARLRLQAQLDHDGRQSDRKRQMELRRDVYLAASEAIVRGAATVSRLTDVRADEGQLGRELQDAAAIITKTHVVANERTVDAVARLQSAITQSFIQLSLARIPIKLRASELDRISADIESERNESARWVELMKQHNLQGSRDQQRWDPLMRQAELTQGRLNELIDKHTKLLDTHLQEIVLYGKEVTERALEVNQLLPDALLAVRAELEIPIDEAHYRQLAQTISAEARVIVDRSLNHLTELTRRRS